MYPAPVFQLLLVALCLLAGWGLSLETDRASIAHQFKHAHKREAVNDAVNFLVSQGEAYKETAAAAATRAQSGAVATSVANDYSANADGSLPVCKATMSAILNDGMFVYRGAEVRSRYNGDTCWARRIAHHVAPTCQVKEAEEGLIPIYKWRWSLRQAEQGKCKMPSTNILQVGKQYLERQAKSPEGLRDTSKLHKDKSMFHDAPGKAVNILMMGLSFMSQPFVSTICLNDPYINQQESFALGAKNAHLTVKDVRRGGGHCFGYDTDKVDEWWPPALHGNQTRPPTNFPHCSMDHGYMLFEAKNAATYRGPNGESAADAAAAAEADPSLPIVRICYTYTFNLQKFVKKGQPLPCNWKWADIDVLLSIHDFKELDSVYMPRTGAVYSDLSTLKIVHVNPIYNGYIEGLLARAYEEKKFHALTHSHVISYPKNCGPGDIHYRLPGVTDFATDIWYSLISSGMHEDMNGREDCGPGQKVCDGNKFMGNSRHVRFWGANPSHQ
jgi:hypothetical protein